jgi:U1 small nuclear ribonucleoprotein C
MLTELMISNNLNKMPKFYCEYCGIYLTHSSPSGRRQHSQGKRHKQNKVEYYRCIKIQMEEEIRARQQMK